MSQVDPPDETSFTPPRQPGPMAMPARQTNTLGLVSFILSSIGLLGAVGVFCCPPFVALAVLGLVGAVLGFIGMRSEPRGFAIAGAVMGVCATGIAIVFAALFGALIGLGVSVEAKWSTTLDRIREAEAVIENEIRIAGRAPDDAEGRDLIATIPDGWDRPLRYRREVGGDYQIISAGMDGRFDTLDDIDRATPRRR